MAERLPGVHIGEVDLDKRDRHPQQGIAQGHAGVRERRRVNQDKIRVATRLMDAINQGMFRIGLQVTQGKAQFTGLGFQTADSGRVVLDGIDTTGLSGEAQRQLRQKIQLVYQNPFASLDPSQSLYQIIEEPLLNFAPLSKSERRARVEEVATRVALPPEVLERKPRALSGGQRQRVAIARALVLRPAILVLDEATSALDVTVQAQILSLLQQLQQQLGLTYLFISHDLATVRRIAHSVTVLRAGQVVDQGPVAALFSHPSSSYTQELIDAIPALGIPPKEYV